MTWYTLTLITQVWGWVATFYIYMSEAVPIDRQSVVCDWRKKALYVAAVRMVVLQLLNTLNWSLQTPSHFSSSLGVTAFLPPTEPKLCSYFSASTVWFFRGPGWLSRYNDSPRDRIPVQARFSAPVRTDPGAHPASSKRGLFPGDKATGAWGWLPAPSSAEAKERVELYLYCSCGSSWHVVGWTSPFPAFFHCQYHFNN